MHDIVFHLGMHKTGTTTLQTQFFPACPGVSFYRGSHPSVRRFAVYLTRTDPMYFEPEEARALLSAQIQPGTLNVISSEALGGQLASTITIPGLDYRSAIIDNLRRTYPDARVILVIRRQDTFAMSLYRQHLHSGGTRTPRRFFCATEDVFGNTVPPVVSRNLFRFGPYLDALQAAFPAGLLALCFEDFVTRRSEFLRELTDFLGIDSPHITLQVTNESRIGVVGMPVLRLLNFLFRTHLNPGGLLPKLPVAQFGRWRLDSPAFFLHRYWPKAGSISKKSELYTISQQILDEMRPDNEALDARYNLGLKQHGYW